MKRFVLDASVSLAWFLDDPIPDFATRARRLLQTGSIAVVPFLWHLEMANGFVIAERRGLLARDFVERGLNDVDGMIPSAIENSSTILSLRQADASARTFALTAYDAFYLETARRERLPLATLDRSLIRAAAQAGVPLLT